MCWSTLISINLRRILGAQDTNFFSHVQPFEPRFNKAAGSEREANIMKKCKIVLSFFI